MKSVSGKKFVRILEKYGWFVVRVSGSHHIMKKEGKSATLSIPVDGNSDLKTGLLKRILKISGLDESVV